MIPYRGAAASLLATCALLGAGCKKEQESLVLAELRLAAADPPATALKSVKLVAIPGREATFDVTTLSATQDTELGLYLPGDVTGTVRIVATAYPSVGCAGFRGMNEVTIASAGVTEMVNVPMTPADVCPPDGGAGGTGGGIAGAGGGTAGAGGGTAGAAGTGGSVGGGGGGTGGTGGATGGAGGYPSIAACRPFYHAATNCPSVYVNAVAISPNGQLVATGGDFFDGRIKIWNFDGRTLSATAAVFTDFDGNALAFSPDGTRFAYTSSTSSTAAVRTYMVPTWSAGPTLQDNGSGNTLRGVAFTPDSLRVVSVNAIGTAGGDVFVHSLASGAGTAPAYTAHIPNEPYGMAVLGPKAPNNGTIGVAVGSYYGTVTVLSLTSTGFTANPVTLPASINTRTTYTVEFSPDGSLLATGENFGAVRFWNYPPDAAPTPVGSAINFANGDSVNDIAFSPNGLYLAAGGAFYSRRLSIYSVSTHAEVATTTPSADVVSLVFSPSGNAIIAGLDDCGTVLVCN